MIVTRLISRQLGEASCPYSTYLLLLGRPLAFAGEASFLADGFLAGEAGFFTGDVGAFFAGEAVVFFAGDAAIFFGDEMGAGVALTFDFAFVAGTAVATCFGGFPAFFFGLADTGDFAPTGFEGVFLALGVDPVGLVGDAGIATFLGDAGVGSVFWRFAGGMLAPFC